MRILHLMLSCFYLDNANYQENIIPRHNKKAGHDVMIIASTEVYIDNINIGYITPRDYVNEDGIPVKRLSYKFIFSNRISRKVRAYQKLYESIEDFNPDIILFHGIAAYALLTVSKYKMNHPQIKFHVDNHADYFNSATNFISKYILHRLFYKLIIHRCLPYIDNIYYITYEAMIFVKTEYCISEKYFQFFPLGGTIPDSLERERVRNKIRSLYNLNDDQILMIHSGRLVPEKRTIEIVRAFMKVNNMNIRLFIVGAMEEDIASIVMPLINSDSRIKYFGWLTGNLLKDYLCASDLYIQLGDQSATMQEALCSGCAAALFPYDSHKYLLKDSVFYVENSKNLTEIIEVVSLNKSILEMKRKESFAIAENLLDYKKISALITY